MARHVLSKVTWRQTDSRASSSAIESLELTVLHAVSSRTFRPQLIACNKLVGVLTLRTLHVACRGCTQQMAGSWTLRNGILGQLADMEPLHVAAQVEPLGRDYEKPSVRQHLAAIRMLFDWPETGVMLSFEPSRRFAAQSVGQILPLHREMVI